MENTPPQYVIVGRVRKAHGIRGELVVEAHTDVPEAVFVAGRRLVAGTASGATPKSTQELHIQHATPFKGGWIVGFEEIRDRNAAELWRERYLLLPSDETQSLGPGEVYLYELPGMRVVLATGEPVGTVLAVYELPQGFMLDVERTKQTETASVTETVMIPYSRVVTGVDRDARVVRIDPPAGLLD